MSFKHLICLGFLLIAVINPSQVKATQVRKVSSQMAQNGISLQVAKGYGLTINFQQTGEQITQSWLSDPSRIVFKVQNQVVFIRRIKPIKFPSITRNKDRSTQFVVLTTSQRGQKQYTFKLIPTETNPEYTSIVLVPSSSRKLWEEEPNLNTI
jgi:hypothetical protein